MYLDDERFLSQFIHYYVVINKTFCNLDMLTTVTRGEIDKPVNLPINFRAKYIIIFEFLQVKQASTLSARPPVFRSPLAFLLARFFVRRLFCTPAF